MEGDSSKVPRRRRRGVRRGSLAARRRRRRLGALGDSPLARRARRHRRHPAVHRGDHRAQASRTGVARKPATSGASACGRPHGRLGGELQFRDHYLLARDLEVVPSGGAGRRQCESAGRGLLAARSPEDRERVRASVDAAMAGTMVQTVEYRVLLPDGNSRWVMTVGRVEHGAEGGPMEGKGVVLDIDDRKRAELAVLESGELLRAVGRSVVSHLCVLDRSGTIVNVNQSWTSFALDEGVVPGEPTAHTGVGANYLDVCRDVEGADSTEARQAHDGIRAVLAEERTIFTLEYACHS